MSKFSKLVGKIRQKEGYSKEAAQKTAAAIGDRKIGKEEMARKAAASRERHESEG